MTEPTTEAGRRLLANWHGDALGRADILAIEAEARADAPTGHGHVGEWCQECRAAGIVWGNGIGWTAGRADALREAAERVRALWTYPDDFLDRAAVLAILDPEAALGVPDAD